MRFCAYLICCALELCSFSTAGAQSPTPSTAPLRQIRTDGLKSLQEPQVAALTGLTTGSPVGKDDLQVAADKLVQSGLFAHVRYNFQSRTDGVVVTFHVEEAKRIPAYFDNLPWFADSELNDAIRQKLAFYDGSLPEQGAVVDQAAEAVGQFLAAHGLQAAVEHQAVPNPVGEGNVQRFGISGESLHIASLQFSDPALNSSRTVQQQFEELRGKPYSRMAIDMFLAEQIRPAFLQKGFLRAKLGPPEVRLSGNPNQKLPEQIPVFVPIDPGAVYHWKGVEWSGNSLLSTITLSNLIGLKPGDVADGMAIEAAWEKIAEEYGRRGYMQAKTDPTPLYDDSAHTVAYTVRVEEGKPFRMGNVTVTGLSTNAEKYLREAWPVPQGEVFDKAKYEEFLTQLQARSPKIFKDIPIHYDEVGHWLQPNDAKGTVDVLLDFQ
jgi:outer membrane protein assembly factor BamA